MSSKKLLVESRFASVSIQKIWRSALVRPVYRAMLVEAEEEARANSKIAALQKRLADAEMKCIKADKARIEAEKRVSGEGPVESAPQTGLYEEKKVDDTVADNSQELLDESTQ